MPVTRDDAAVAIAREAFGAWLRSERETRGIPLEDIARVTKIQMRALERLEDAAFDELPADVFVRGFIRNYSRVVGLDADKVLARYDDCGVTPGPVAEARARAMMSVFDGPAPARRRPEATPAAAVVAATRTTTPIAIAAAPEPVAGAAEEPTPKKRHKSHTSQASQTKKKPRGGKRRSKKAVEAVAPVAPVAPVTEPEVDDFEMTVVEEPEPVIAAPAPVAAPRKRITAPTPIPTLVIDDDDPDTAERAQAARELDEKLARDKAGRGFLPQALLDGDRGTRQGGLTLAVIILLIVATLTLSYLMRRPSSSGEGVTSLPARVLVG